MTKTTSNLSNYSLPNLKTRLVPKGSSLMHLLTLFVEQMITPVLAVQFFHADLGHIPFHISTARQ